VSGHYRVQDLQPTGFVWNFPLPRARHLFGTVYGPGIYHFPLCFYDNTLAATVLTLSTRSWRPPLWSAKEFYLRLPIQADQWGYSCPPLLPHTTRPSISRPRTTTILFLFFLMMSSSALPSCEFAGLRFTFPPFTFPLFLLTWTEVAFVFNRGGKPSSHFSLGHFAAAPYRCTIEELINFFWIVAILARPLAPLSCA